jgi:cysteine desulfurase
MFRRVYLDNSATTAADPAIVEAMMPYFSEEYGNASSIHYFGQKARAAVDKARHQVAELLNSRPNEIIFTSGGTEANNLAVRGLMQANSKHGKHMITSSIEHPSVGSVCEDLEAQGFRVTYLPVYEDGIVRIGDLKDAITDDTILVSIMTANNEIGTIQPVEEIGQLVRDLRAGGKKIWFHTDAVQAAGKIPVDVEAFGCDLLTISAHKIYAPKGVGALYVRRGARLHPQSIGGRQERGIRGGTESVPNIVALGAACLAAKSDLVTTATILRDLRDTFESRIGELVTDITFNGHRDMRIPNVSSISFGRVEGEGLLINLDMHGVAVSTGSACSSGSLEPSPVIRALFCGSPHAVRASETDELARTAIRFSFGKYNTDEDVDRVLDVLPKAVDGLRQLSPFCVQNSGK